MNGLRVCTLVLEYNYGSGPHRGSVWLFPGDGNAGIASPDPLESIPGWIRLAGPIDYQLASDIHAQLKSFFETASVIVIDIGVAD